MTNVHEPHRRRPLTGCPVRRDDHAGSRAAGESDPLAPSHPTGNRVGFLRGLRWRSLAACCLAALACAAVAADGGRSGERPRDGQWIIFDSHSHTTFSDGRHDPEEVVRRAAEQGCDALAITDHADINLDAASPAYFAAVNDARKKSPGLLVLAGLEWNVPPYEMREHVTVLLEPRLAESVLPRLKQLFKGGGRADPALRWLAAALPSPDDGVLFYNHPSRRDPNSKENLKDMRAWRKVNDLVVGFEGAPGHQRMTPAGSYDTGIRTVDRWDPVVAEIGGTWDTLLDGGTDVWAALAVSDYHGDAKDYRPCEFARTHVYVRAVTVQALLAALRAGSFWADHGRILDRFELSVSSPASPRKAMPGESLSVSRYDGATVVVQFERGPGAVGAPLTVEIIGNCVGGAPELIAVDQLQDDDTKTEQRIEHLLPGSDRKSCYVRAQVRRAFDGAPDLMAVTNAVRLTLDADPALATSPRGASGNEAPSGGNLVTSLGIIGGLAVIVVLLATGVMWVRARLLDDKPRRRSSAPGSRSVTGKHAGGRRRRGTADESGAITFHSAVSSTSLSVDEKVRKLELLKDGARRLRLPYERVHAFEVRVNGQTITRVSRQQPVSGDDAFDELLARLLDLQTARVHTDDTRRLDLVTTYDGGVSPEHVLNFYYRVGNRRRSPQSFEDSAQAIVEWLRYLDGEVFASGETPGLPRRANGEVGDRTGDGERESIARELERLADLRARAELTDEEYEKAKARLLK